MKKIILSLFVLSAISLAYGAEEEKASMVTPAGTTVEVTTDKNEEKKDTASKDAASEEIVETSTPGAKKPVCAIL